MCVQTFRDSRNQLGNTGNDLLREAAEGVTKAFRAAGDRKPGTLPSQRHSPPKAKAASGGGGAFAKTREILAKKRRGSFQRLYERDDAPLYSHEQGVEPSQRSPPPPGTEAAILKDSRHRLPDTEDPPEGVGPEGTIEDARVEEEEVSMLAQARAELEHAVLEKRRQISDMVNDVESLSQLKDVQAQILQDREHLQELQQAADTDVEDVDFESQLIRLRHRIQQLEGERAELIDARAQAERAREYSNEMFASQGVSALNTEHLKAETFEDNAYAYDQLARENTHLLEQQEALAQALETQEAYIGQLREFEESVKAMEEATWRKGQLEARLRDLQTEQHTPRLQRPSEPLAHHELEGHAGAQVETEGFVGDGSLEALQEASEAYLSSGARGTTVRQEREGTRSREQASARKGGGERDADRESMHKTVVESGLQRDGDVGSLRTQPQKQELERQERARERDTASLHDDTEALDGWGGGGGVGGWAEEADGINLAGELQHESTMARESTVAGMSPRNTLAMGEEVVFMSACVPVHAVDIKCWYSGCHDLFVYYFVSTCIARMLRHWR